MNVRVSLAVLGEILIQTDQDRVENFCQMMIENLEVEFN